MIVLTLVPNPGKPEHSYLISVCHSLAYFDDVCKFEDGVGICETSLESSLVVGESSSSYSIVSNGKLEMILPNGMIIIIF